MRYYLAMIWLLWFMAFRCVQNEKVKVEKYDGNVGLMNEQPNELFFVPDAHIFNGIDSFGSRLTVGVSYEKEDTIKYIEVANDDSCFAYWEDGKWQITNCEKALDVMVSTVNYLQEQINEKQKQETLNATYTKQ